MKLTWLACKMWPGALVEYESSKKGWIPTKVSRVQRQKTTHQVLYYNKSTGYYDLECKAQVPRAKIRRHLAGFLLCSVT